MGQELGLVTNFENKEIQIYGDKELSDNSNKTELSKEVIRIKNIAKTDINSAITLALNFSQKLLNNPDLSRSIFTYENGYAIEPENIPQVFIELELFSQAQAILNKLLRIWPQNPILLKMAANMAHDKGNHSQAVGVFALLDVYDTLTREDKQKFASSLEYLDQWEYAYELRKSINITNDQDLCDTFLSAYYAGKIDALKSLIKDDRQLTHSSRLSLLLHEIANENSEQIILLSESLEPSDFSNERDKKYFLLIANYLIRNGEVNKAIKILEDCVKNSSINCSIINHLYSYYQIKGESEKSRTILDAYCNQNNYDQKSFEVYIDSLIQIGEFEKADELLINNLKSWELSPRKIGLSAKILLEKGKFIEAEKALFALTENDSCDIDSKFIYCLATLKCKLADFPIGINIENTSKIEKLRKIVDFDEVNGNIYFELLDAEFSVNNRFEKYQQLLQKYSESNNPEIWRIFAGLGKTYFGLNQFDSAIINIKRAYQTVSNNQILFWLLIRSYANLRLWNEIEGLLNQGLAIDNLALLRNINDTGIFSGNQEWARFLEKLIQKKSDEIVYKVLFAKTLVESDRKAEAVEIVKNFYESLQVESEYYLFCVQILVDAEEVKLAERLIEIFLVNKKSPDQLDYLSCAFLYLQLGKSEKALTMMNHLETQDFALMTLKSKLLSDSGKTELSQKIINQLIDNAETNSYDLNNLVVRIPEVLRQIQKNPTQTYLLASSLALKNNDIEKAISILENGLTKNSENIDILFRILDLLNRTGKNDELKSLIEAHKLSTLEILSPSLLCLLGEIALSQNEEVSSARYLSEAMKVAPEDPRVKALQVRMIAIHGNAQEAKGIFKDIIKEMEINRSGIKNSTDLADLDSKYWFANAALDVKDYKTALDVYQKEILNFGYFPSITYPFLSALSARLEEEFFLHELKINKHADLIQDETIKVYLKILEIYNNAHSNDLYGNIDLIKCQLFLENNVESLSIAEKLEPKPENINSIIHAIYKSKGLESAEIAFNSFITNSDNELFFAMLGKDENPEKALGHLKKANTSNPLDARYHALLAIIEKNLGNLPEAYAAICVALEQWPDEFEWQILAGDLSKAAGELHTSLLHYKEAQRLTQIHVLDNNIEDLYLSMETEEAIPILENKLSKNPNIEQSIKLGKIYLKSGNYRKAVQIFESATKEYPNAASPYYWLSEISLILENSGKALENIDKAIENDSMNSQYICRKAEIII